MPTISTLNLLVTLGVNCLLIEDFNITICEGVCANRVVATSRLRLPALLLQARARAATETGEVKTVIVKCNDVRKPKTYIGEHSLTYMEYQSLPLRNLRT